MLFLQNLAHPESDSSHDHLQEFMCRKLADYGSPRLQRAESSSNGGSLRRYSSSYWHNVSLQRECPHRWLRRHCDRIGEYMFPVLVPYSSWVHASWSTAGTNSMHGRSQVFLLGRIAWQSFRIFLSCEAFSFWAFRVSVGDHPRWSYCS